MNIEKNINKPKMKKFNGKGLKKALVSSMLALTLVANPASGVVNNNANAKTKPTIKMYGKKNYTVYTGESLKIGKTVPKYKGKKLAAKKFKVTVKKNEVSYPAIANNIKNNKAVTFASSGTYNVTYKATSPVGTTKTATRKITVLKNIKDDLVATTEQSRSTTDQKYSVPSMYSGYDIKSLSEIMPNSENGMINYTRDQKFIDKVLKGKEYDSFENEWIIDDNGINIEIENYYLKIDYYAKENNIDDVLDNLIYLPLLGKIRAYDKYGNDISNNIVILDNKLRGESKRIHFYVRDNENNEKIANVFIGAYNNKNHFYEELDYDCELISEKPLIEVTYRENNKKLTHSKK